MLLSHMFIAFAECEQNVHKVCMDAVHMCSGKKSVTAPHPRDKIKRPQSMLFPAKRGPSPSTGM